MLRMTIVLLLSLMSLQVFDKRVSKVIDSGLKAVKSSTDVSKLYEKSCEFTCFFQRTGSLSCLQL